MGGGDEEGLRQRSTSKSETKKKPKLEPGDLLKATIRPGGGESGPQDGYRVIFHCTVRTGENVIVHSTRLEHGGNGTPHKVVLGKSKIIRAWEEGIPSMLKGEIAMFKVKPHLHYGDPECPVSVPDNISKDEELLFEIELIDFFNVKVIADDLGVLKKVLKEGEGWETAREPYEVKIWLSIRKPGGETIFTMNETEPIHFTFGKKEVPDGLEQGVGTMTRGEKAVIYVSRPHLTNGHVIPSLPSDSEELEFEVEMIQIIQVRDMVGDGRVVKRRLQDGRGEFPMDCPLHDSILRIHYKGMLPDYDGRVFYDTRVGNNSGGEPLEFASGEGLVPEGLEMSVRLMLPGEIALVTSTSEFAYDKFPRPELVPEGANVQWEVQLIDFDKPKDWSGLTFAEIMDEAENIKKIGNRLFKEGKYELAKSKYEKVLRDFNHVNPEEDEEGKIFLQARSQLNLNMAATYQKLGENVKSIEWCNKVLDENPCHVKALYRRGMAYMDSGDFEEARNDFKMMSTADKSSEAEANAALAKLRRKEQEAELRARKQFKGLFDKKPGELSLAEETESKREVADASVNKDHAECLTEGPTNLNLNPTPNPNLNQAGYFRIPSIARKLITWAANMKARGCTIL